MVKTFDCGSSNIRSIRMEHPKLIKDFYGYSTECDIILKEV